MFIVRRRRAADFFVTAAFTILFFLGWVIPSAADMVDLGTLGGTGSSAFGISADGTVIVGSSDTTGDVATHAFIYSGVTMTDLGTLGGSSSVANAISGNGSVIVGSSLIVGDAEKHAFSYSGAVMTDLGTLGGTFSSANAVSADGSVIVGVSRTGGAVSHAFSYSGAVMTDLGTLGGNNSYALAISTDGSVIVGQSYLVGDVAFHAFSYAAATMTDLGTLGGTNSLATAVSSDGSVIVGQSNITGDLETHAFSYAGAVMTDLGTLGGKTSVATGVSADGSVIVGYSLITGNTATHAFVYRSSMVDINNTAETISTTASATRGYADMRSASLWSMANYDCANFGDNGLCMSVGGRYASQSGDFAEAAGTAIVAMPLGENIHAGLFFDYADSNSNPDGFAVDSGLPTVGGFIGYRATPGKGGLGVRVSGAFQSGEIDITRQALAGTEAGQGKADTQSYVLNAEVSYGMWLVPA